MKGISIIISKAMGILALLSISSCSDISERINSRYQGVKSFIHEVVDFFDDYPHYYREYEYGDWLVRRYDKNYVYLECIKDGKVIDRVKADIDYVNDYDINIGLYFQYDCVSIVGEDWPNRVRRCITIKDLFDFPTLLRIVKGSGFWIVRRLSLSYQELVDWEQHLAWMKQNGRYYRLGDPWNYMWEADKQNEDNPTNVRVSVIGDDGTMLYTNF